MVENEYRKREQNNEQTQVCAQENTWRGLIWLKKEVSVKVYILLCRISCKFPTRDNCFREIYFVKCRSCTDLNINLAYLVLWNLNTFICLEFSILESMEGKFCKITSKV